MNNKRFENDERLSYIYEVLNKAKFRNYIYAYDKKSNYCDYIDEYETAIDDRNDKIKKLEQALDEIEKYIEEHKVKHYKLIDRPDGIDIILLENEIDDLLEIIQKAKGDVKNENNNV